MERRVPYTGKHDSNKIIVIFKILYCQEFKEKTDKNLRKKGKALST